MAVRQMALVAAILAMSSPANADWDLIDCSKSEVTIPGATECRHGPTARPGNANVTCDMERYSTFHAASSAGAGPQFRMSVQSLTNHSHVCAVLKVENNQDFLRNSTPYAQKGEKWGPIRDFLSGYVANFIGDGRECVAFVQYSSQIISHQTLSGYDYMFRGYYCVLKGQQISDTELEEAIKSVHISR
jgi:hypothetical protein